MGYSDKLFQPDSTSQSAISGSKAEQAKFTRLSVPTLEEEEGKYTQGAAGSFLAGVPINRQDAIKVLSERTGLPVTRFVIDAEGNIGYKGEDNKYYPAIGSTAGYYGPDILQGGLDVIGAAGATSFLGPVGAGLSSGGISAGTEAARQAYARELADSDTSDVGRIALAGLLGTAGEVAPFGVKLFKGAKQAPDLYKLNQADLQNILKLSEDFDVPLTIPELTNLPSLKSKQYVASKVGVTADKIDEFYKMRAGKVEDAVNKYLDNISLTKETWEGGKSAKDTLLKRKDDLIATRRESTKPIYDEALKNAQPVNTTDIVKKLDAMIDVSKGRETQVLQKIKNDFYRNAEQVKLDAKGNPVKDKFGNPVVESVRVLDDRPQALQRLKMELDTYLRSEDVAGLDSVIQGEIKGIRNNLKNAVRQDNDLYKQADARYAELSKPIEEFDTSKAGDILTKIKDYDADKLVTKLFKDSDPMTIRYAKKQIESVNPEAWNEVTRAWLQQNWEQANKVFRAQKDLPKDAGLSWRNLLLGTERQRKSLEAALSPEQYKSLQDLSTVLEAAGRVEKGNSLTAFSQEALKDFKKSGWDLADIEITKPQGTILQVLKDRAFEKNVNKFTDIILDPAKMKELDELKKLPSGSLELVSGVTRLLTVGPTIGSPSNVERERQQLQKTQEILEGDTSYSNMLFGS